jgi:hypothetical protein
LQDSRHYMYQHMNACDCTGAARARPPAHSFASTQRCGPQDNIAGVRWHCDRARPSALSEALSCGPQRVPQHQRHSGRTQPPLSPRLQAAAAGARRGAVQVRTASAATVPWQPSAPRLCGTGNARGSERQARRPGPAGCATKECLSTRPPGGAKAAAGRARTPRRATQVSRVPCISQTDARRGLGGRRAQTATSAQGGARCVTRSAVAALALGVHSVARAGPRDASRRAGDRLGIGDVIVYAFFFFSPVFTSNTSVLICAMLHAVAAAAPAATGQPCVWWREV